MTDSSLMRANVTAISPLITDPNTTPFLPVPPHAISDWLNDLRFLGTIQGGNYGSTAVWEITKNSAVIFKFYLRAIRPAFPIPAGATFLRPVDWVGISDIKELRFIYFANTIYKFTYEYLYSRIRNNLDINKLLAYQTMCCGDHTGAQRSQLAQAGHVTVTPLMMDFSEDTTKCAPIVALAQKPRLEIDLQNINMQYQTDLNVGTALVDPGIVFSLLVSWIQINQEDATYLANKSDTPDGIAYLNSNKIQVDQWPVSVPPATTTSTQLDFRLMNRGTIKEMEFYLTPQQLRNTVYGNDYFVTANAPVPLPAPNGTVSMGAYAEILSYFATANGTDLFRQQCTNQNMIWIKNGYYKEAHTGRPGENRYRINFSLGPEMANSCLGNLAFANLGNPQLSLVFAPNGTGGLPGGTGTNPITSATQALTLVIVYWMYTYIQYQGGDVVEAFV